MEGEAGAGAGGGAQAEGVAEEMPDVNDADLEAAATKIQAAHRGKAAREEVAAMRADAGVEAGADAGAEAGGEGDEDYAARLYPADELCAMMEGEHRHRASLDSMCEALTEHLAQGVEVLDLAGRVCACRRTGKKGGCADIDTYEWELLELLLPQFAGLSQASGMAQQNLLKCRESP